MEGGWGARGPTAAAAQARPMRGERARASCAIARLGLRSRPAGVGPRACASAAGVCRAFESLTRAPGCAAPPQIATSKMPQLTTSAMPARLLWPPRSRRTSRSRRSALIVREPARWPAWGMEGGMGGAWAHGRGRPRRRARCGEIEREPLSRSRASGCALALPASGPAHVRAPRACVAPLSRLTLTRARGVLHRRSEGDCRKGGG